jgi:hypothetical protein
MGLVTLVKRVLKIGDTDEDAQIRARAQSLASRLGEAAAESANAEDNKVEAAPLPG